MRSTKSLVEGASALDVGVHLLPAAPRDVRDDGSFRYAVLGPEAVSDSGKPSLVAKRFLDETTGPDRPRVHRNAVVLAVPSRDGLEAARAAVRALLGWEEVQAQLAGHEVDAVQAERLRRRLQEGRGRVPEAVRHAYAVVVTVNESNAVHAFRLVASGRPLFTEIKNDGRSRIKETPVDAAALLPGGPYNLWNEDEDARFVKDLAGAFARYPRLPKVLISRVLLDTVLQGVQRGLLVARLVRPDGSMRTWWREEVDAAAREDPQLEVVLPEQAELSVLSDALLKPGELPELWSGPESAPAVTLPDVEAYFGGGRVVRIPSEDYEEPYTIPRCSGKLVRAAVERAVRQGTVWLTSGPASVWKEPIPYGALDANAVLHPPPEPIAPQDLVEAALPGAWTDGKTNGIALAQALSQNRGTTLPWGLIRDAIKASTASRWLRLVTGSDPVDSAYEAAGSLVLERPVDESERYTVKPPTGGAVLEVDEIQDLADLTPRLLEASAGAELRFHLRVVLDGDLSPDDRIALDELLAQVSEDLKITLDPAVGGGEDSGGSLVARISLVAGLGACRVAQRPFLHAQRRPLEGDTGARGRLCAVPGGAGRRPAAHPERTWHRSAVRPPGGRLPARAGRRQRGAGHAHRLGKDPRVQPADPHALPARRRGDRALSVPDQGAVSGPAGRAGRSGAGRRPAGAGLHLRRRHAGIHAGLGPRAGPHRHHQSGHAAHGRAAASPQVGPVLPRTALRGDRRAAHLPRRVRLPSGQRHSPPEADRGVLRSASALRLLLGYHRQPAGAGPPHHRGGRGPDRPQRRTGR